MSAIFAVLVSLASLLSGLSECAETDLSNAAVRMESILARMNERPEDVVAYLESGKDDKVVVAGHTIVLIIDEYAEDGRTLKIGLDMGITVETPCGNPKKDQVSRFVALPASLSRYSKVEIHCVNLQFCPTPYQNQACLMNPQQQVIVAYNRIRDELLEKIEARLQAVSYTLAELKTHTDATVETNEISQDLEIEEADEETNSISDDWGWSEDQEDKSTTTEEGVRNKSADDFEDIDANDWTWWTQN